MRFTTPQDYQTMVRINQELINVVVDNRVILYKIQQDLTNVNSYGEATKKTWYTGVEIPLLYRREQQNPTQDMQNINFEQRSEFHFLRQECIDRKIYPEVGDVIYFDSQYYEIDNINEIQLVAGRPEYNHSISCETHLTRKPALQLDPPQK